MANANKPMGLSPHSYLNGATWNGQARAYYIASTDPNAFAIGDPVTLAGSGDAAEEGLIRVGRIDAKFVLHENCGTRGSCECAAGVPR